MLLCGPAHRTRSRAFSELSSDARPLGPAGTLEISWSSLFGCVGALEIGRSSLGHSNLAHRASLASVGHSYWPRLR